MSADRTVSVIIHFLNSEKHLSDAIDSVFRQTYEDWDLVLVDGGSTDGTVDIARSYVKAHPRRVSLLEHKEEEPLGIYSSRIWGAQEARSPLLALLDSDDEWHPQFLARHKAIHDSVFRVRPGMLYCPVTYWWEPADLAHNSYVQPIPKAGVYESPDLIMAFIEDGYEKSAANSGVMISRSILLDAAELIGLAAEGIADDQFLWSFVLLKAPVYVSPEPLVRYRQWDGSTCSVATKAGTARKARKDHLTWLVDYLGEHYVGERRDELISEVSHMLEKEFPAAN